MTHSHNWFHSKILLTFLFLSVVIEILCQTFFNSRCVFTSVLHLFSGVSIGIIPLFNTSKTKFELESPIFYYIGLMLLLILMIYGFYWGNFRINRIPLDYKFSDVLPVIKIMSERLLNNESVYSIIPEIWNGIQPRYLPAMWLPYVIPISLGLDLRFMNLSAILLFLILSSNLVQGKIKYSSKSLLIFIPLSIITYYIFSQYHSFYLHSQESIVILFYLILGILLVKEKSNGIFLGIFLACCLLSRYALAFWAVFYWLYSFKLNKVFSLKVLISGLIFGIMILFISQGFNNISLFFSLSNEYLVTLQDPASKEILKYLTESNLGLAKFFRISGLPLLHTLLIIGSFLIPMLSIFIFHYWLKKKKIDYQLYSLCTLKLCVVYFFCFNPLPYANLFWTSTAISLVLLNHTIDNSGYTVNIEVAEIK